MEPVISKLDTFMNSPIFKVFCIIDTLVSVVSAFFLLTSTAGTIIFIIATVLLSITVFFLLYRYKKLLYADKKNIELLEEIEEKMEEEKKVIDLLEQNIHNGLKYTKNTVIVTLDKKERKYLFEFIKDFEVISDNTPKWYSAQFYANKILKDKNQSKEYYKKHVVKWDNLKVRASISFLHPDAKDYTKRTNLKIDNITDENNYIPFNIQYITFRGNRALDIKKGTKVRLKYCYNVPIDIWGSYINRTISYFQEPTKVILKYAIDTDLEIKVSTLSNMDGSPVDTEMYDTSIDEENEYVVHTIKLKSYPFAKYRVWWDSEQYFENDKTTEDTADKSQLTKY